ncbi:glycosyltransferase family 4 protein [Rickettsiella endosymbiont of Xylota segnis]|uniref:glycosyltransferase family 4 protein n=1 Tax=Rickettsiella endosymbiont of Xylota segnis TaxID=3066238 RepID=UPI0030D21F50
MLTDNYPPEMNANARIFSELAEIWADHGDDVSIITCHPNFPRGKVFDGYKNRWYTKEIFNKVKLIRIKTYMSANCGVIKRTLDFISFALSSFFCGLFQPKPDVIIGVTPQFFCALSACLLSIKKKSAFVMIVCDLWPDAVVASGLINKNWIYKLLKKIEYWMYQQANSIIILSENYRSYLNNLGIPDKKIVTSISGASKQFYPRKKNSILLDEYNLSGKFVIGYIGTFGIFYNYQNIFALAKSFKKNAYSHIHFLMVGDGPKRKTLEQQILNQHLNNINICGPFAGEIIPEYWSLVDLAIIPLASIEINKMVLPSKIIEAMAMGIPILLYGPDGEARKFLSQSDSGWYMNSSDKKNLEHLLLSLSTNKQELLDHGAKAFKFAKNFSREKQAEELLTHLKSINNNKSI